MLLVSKQLVYISLQIEDLITLYRHLKNISNNFYVTVSESEVAQLCLTLCDPMDCSLPGSFLHGILQARVMEWVTIS